MRSIIISNYYELVLLFICRYFFNFRRDYEEATVFNTYNSLYFLTGWKNGVLD